MTSIALPLPEEDRDLAEPKIYPTKGAVEGFDVVNSFSFDMASFINERLAENGKTIDDYMVQDMVYVLEIVGKVCIECGKHSINNPCPRGRHFREHQYISGICKSAVLTYLLTECASLHDLLA
jgi:hypothetical protein